MYIQRKAERSQAGEIIRNRSSDIQRLRARRRAGLDTSFDSI